MSGLLAVATREVINALLCAVASTMPSLVTDNALDLGAIDNFGNLFLAPLLDVAELTAVTALWNAGIEWHACSLLETLDVFFGCSWPACSKEGALRLGSPVESELELLIDGTGGANEGEDIADFFFLSRS